jgi:hypothetical protein
MSTNETANMYVIKSTSRGQKPDADGNKPKATPRTVLFDGSIDLTEFENGDEIAQKLVRFGIETILRKELTGALNKVFNETGDVSGYRAPDDTQAVAIIERVLAGKTKPKRESGAKAKELKEKLEAQQAALARLEELRQAYKEAKESGDEKAIKKAEKALLAG